MKSVRTLFPEIVLGGEFAISYPVGLALLPLITLGVPLAEWLKNSEVAFADWTIASAVGAICAALLLVILDNSFLKNRAIRPIPNNALFGIGFLLGWVKGFATGIIAVRFLEIPGVDLDDNIKRSLTSALIGMIALPTISFCTYSWYQLVNHRSFSKERLNSIDELKTLTENEIASRIIIEDTKQHLDKVKSEFTKAAKRSSKIEGAELADLLEKLAREVIRPLSHKVAKGQKTHTSFFQVLIDSFNLFPIVLSRSIPWILSLFSLFSGSLLFDKFTLPLGSMLLVLEIVTLAIPLYGLKALISFLRPHIIFIVFASIFALLLADFFHYLIFLWLTGDNSPRNFLVNFYTLSILFFVSGFANIFSVFEVRKNNSYDAKYMSEFDNILRRNSARTEINNEIVRFLHGTLQTRLSSSAFRFRNSSIKPESFDFEEEYQKVLSHFDIDSEISQVATGENLVIKLNEIVKKWEGLIHCSIELNVDQSRLYQGQVSRICDFVNEALSNALRHGNATSATIYVTDAVKDVLIAIHNDGQPLSKSPSGLGSKLYDELTDGRWEILSSKQGSGVRVSGLISRFL